MPSGAKKRKAAKKKKEKEKEKENNINPPTNNPQGTDELKSQDEKGSDSGEGSLPVYHDHDDDHNPFNGGSEEVEERPPSAAQSSASDAKSMEEVSSDIKIDKVVGGKEDSVSMTERDLKSEESYESKNVSVKQIESAKESYYGNGNAGGTSNEESLTEKNSKDENCNSIEEAITARMTLITENAPVEETGNSFKAVASVSEVKSQDIGTVLLEKSIVPPVGVTNLTIKINEDSVHPLTDESAKTSSLEEPKPKEDDSKVLASLSVSPFTKSTNGTVHIKDSETPECSENQPLVVSVPCMVQKTTWLSCCGLFEVLSGSNR